MPTLTWLPSTLLLAPEDVVCPDASAGLSTLVQPEALLSPDGLFEDPESFAQPTTDSTLVSAIAVTATPRLKRKAFSLRVHTRPAHSRRTPTYWRDRTLRSRKRYRRVRPRDPIVLGRACNSTQRDRPHALRSIVTLLFRRSRPCSPVQCTAVGYAL